MLEEQRWGLAILVSQKACEGPSKTHLVWVRGVLREDQWRSSKGDLLLVEPKSPVLVSYNIGIHTENNMSREKYFIEPHNIFVLFT
jgi:hypothetical protein